MPSDAILFPPKILVAKQFDGCCETPPRRPSSFPFLLPLIHGHRQLGALRPFLLLPLIPGAHGGSSPIVRSSEAVSDSGFLFPIRVLILIHWI